MKYADDIVNIMNGRGSIKVPEDCTTSEEFDKWMHRANRGGKRMTRDEASKMAKADLECMERYVNGCDEMCNSHKCDECALNYEKGNMGEQKEWLRLVIKALEQEPCEDAISRQAAIDACLNGWNKDYKEIVEEIRTLPPVTPQPKTGHWIGDGNYICSCCKCNPLDVFLEPLGLDGGSYMSVPMKYCPNCGAKMVDPQESEE